VSRVTVRDALIAAVAADTRLKAVGPDVQLIAQKLPAAGISYAGDEPTVTGSDSRTFRFDVRVYVRLGRDLGAAETELLSLADRLDEHLSIYRRLTETAEVIGRSTGDVIEMPGEQTGPDLLCYEQTVSVEQRAPYDAVLSDGTNRVTIHDVTAEVYPTQPPTLALEPDATGALVAYLSHVNPETMRVAGQVTSVADASRLAGWIEASTALAYTDIRRAATSGWRVLGAPAPRVDRRNTGAESFDVDLTLWRV
jgi:hypothetical protein